MYLLFRYKNMIPSDYKKLGHGEKQIIRQFMYQQIEDTSKEYKAMFGGE